MCVSVSEWVSMSVLCESVCVCLWLCVWVCVCVCDRNFPSDTAAFHHTHLQVTAPLMLLSNNDTKWLSVWKEAETVFSSESRVWVCLGSDCNVCVYLYCRASLSAVALDSYFPTSILIRSALLLHSSSVMVSRSFWDFRCSIRLKHTAITIRYMHRVPT